MSFDKIAKSKAWADGEKYFSLFEKHIPRNLAGKRVLFYDIGNAECIAKIMELNPLAEYNIFGSSCIAAALNAIGKSCNEIKDIEDMKFDCVIGNPPYDRSLHLKILKEVMKHVDFENGGEIVWLAPVRWLQDPLAKYKKNSDYLRYEKNISNYINSLEVIDGDVISKIFDGGLPTSAIYTISSEESDLYKTKFFISFVDKIFNKIKGNSLEFDQNKKDGFRVKISPIYGGGTAGNHSGGIETLRNVGKLICFENGLKDGKPWHSFYAHNGSTKIQDDIPYSIKFNSLLEAENFIKSYQTNLVKCYTHFVKRDVNVSPEIIVWMGSAVNPRTGKLGYESEWTDADFYAYFKLTPEEIKVIEDTMKKYSK